MPLYFQQKGGGALILNMKSRANIKVSKLTSQRCCCNPVCITKKQLSSYCHIYVLISLRPKVSPSLGWKTCWCTRWVGDNVGKCCGWHKFSRGFNVLSCVCVSTAGPQWRTRPSQRRIGVTPPCPVGLPAEPPANHTTFWEGEMCLKLIHFKHSIKTTNIHYTHTYPHHTLICFFLLSHTCSLCYFAFCNCSISVALLWFTGMPRCFALSLYVASCQSRPRRPVHKQKAPRDEQDTGNTEDTWDGWESELRRPRKKITIRSICFVVCATLFCTLCASEPSLGPRPSLTRSSRRMRRRGKIHCCLTRRRWICSGRSLTRSAPAAPTSAACCTAHAAWICLDRTVMTISWR